MKLGHFSDEAVSAAKRLLSERMEFSELETIDFALCRRPDSSIYGIADGAQCRKGVLTTRDDVIGKVKDLYSRSGRKLGSAEKKIDAAFAKLSDDEIANIANSVAASLESGIISRENSLGTLRFTSMSTWGQLKALEDNKEKLLAGFENPALLTGNLRKVSDDELDAFMLVAGHAFGKGDGLTVPKGKTPRLGLNEDGTHSPGGSDWRKRELARRWLEQGGRDLYTGLPLSKADAALEHIIPYSTGHTIAENKANWGWIDRGVNDHKTDLSMKDFFDRQVSPKLVKGQAAYNEEYRQRMTPFWKAWKTNTEKLAGDDEFARKTAHAFRNNPTKLLERLQVTRPAGGFDVVKFKASGRNMSAQRLPSGMTYGQALIRNWARIGPEGRAAVVEGTRKLIENSNVHAKAKMKPEERDQLFLEGANKLFADLNFILEP